MILQISKHYRNKVYLKSCTRVSQRSEGSQCSLSSVMVLHEVVDPVDHIQNTKRTRKELPAMESGFRKIFWFTSNTVQNCSIPTVKLTWNFLLWKSRKRTKTVFRTNRRLTNYSRKNYHVNSRKISSSETKWCFAGLSSKKETDTPMTYTPQLFADKFR